MTSADLRRGTIAIIHWGMAILAVGMALVACPWTWQMVEQQQQFCAYPFHSHHFPIRPLTAALFATPYAVRLLIYVILPAVMVVGVILTWRRWPREPAFAVSLIALHAMGLIIAVSLIAIGLPYWTLA